MGVEKSCTCNTSNLWWCVERALGNGMVCECPRHRQEGVIRSITVSTCDERVKVLEDLVGKPGLRLCYEHRNPRHH